MRVLQVQLHIAADPAEAGRARRWVRAQLAGCGVGVDTPLAETTVLLVSELVTNAVVHAGSSAALRLSLAPGAPLRLEVCDGSARTPEPRRAADQDTGGRGLELVCCLADRWGWDLEGAGKSVWCEIDPPAPVVPGPTPAPAPAPAPTAPVRLGA